MRVIVLSDSHGEDTNLRWMLEQCWRMVGPVDAYIHCGDGARDFQRLENFIRARDGHALLIGVKGNCDFFDDVPEITQITLGGVRILVTHGHRFQVKRTYAALDMEAKQRKCRVALFGHTHQPWIEQRHALLVNPGSAADDHLALLEIENGKVQAQLMDF